MNLGSIVGVLTTTAVTVLGAYLVKKGLGDQATAEAIIGGVTALIGIAAQLLHHKKALDTPPAN